MQTHEIHRLRAAALPVYRGDPDAVAAARFLVDGLRHIALVHGTDEMQSQCARAALSGVQHPGQRAIQAALAFWASETDPAMWQAVVEGN